MTSERRTLREFMRTSYLEGATGPRQYDCGAFVRDVVEEVFDVRVPDLAEIRDRCGELSEDVKRIYNVLTGTGFRKIEEPEAGDIVAISRFNNGFIDHIGVMIDGERFIQMDRRGPGICSVGSVLFRRRIKGFYRCGK